MNKNRIDNYNRWYELSKKEISMATALNCLRYLQSPTSVMRVLKSAYKYSQKYEELVDIYIDEDKDCEKTVVYWRNYNTSSMCFGDCIQTIKPGQTYFKVKQEFFNSIFTWFVEQNNQFVKQKEEPIKEIDIKCFFVIDGILTIKEDIDLTKFSNNLTEEEKLLIKEVILPSNLKTIDGGAFADCKCLEKITIPDSVKRIGCSAFDGCLNLKEIKLPGTLEYIEDNVFANCKSLEKINIPDSIKKIGKYIFYNCINLKQIHISKNTYKKATIAGAFNGIGHNNEDIINAFVNNIETKKEEKEEKVLDERQR